MMSYMFLKHMNIVILKFYSKKSFFVFLMIESSFIINIKDTTMIYKPKCYVVGILLFMSIFFGCDDSKKQSSHTQDLRLGQEKWLFSTQYIKAISDSSWEKVTVNAMNDYQDFKIDFTFISTGKPQTCGLYAKGVFMNSVVQGETMTRNKKRFLLRPNLIPKTTILFIQEYDSIKGDFIRLEISDMVEFIQACGDAHQYAVGEYNAV